MHCRLYDAVVAIVSHQTPIAGILETPLGLQIIATEPEILRITLGAKEVNGATKVSRVG